MKMEKSTIVEKPCVLRHGLVKNLKKLAQGDLVHAVDKTHLTDEEIQDAASRCNCTHTFTRAQCTRV